MSLNRRQALLGAATAGIGVPLLAACGADESAVDSQPAGSPSSDAPPSAAPTSEGAATETAEAGASGLTTVEEIEVGGGEIFATEQVVVTQPAAGDFKCFSAVCPHQGCVVSSVEDGQILCKCHGSAFSIEDGSVLAGPSPSGLSEVPMSVEGDSIVLT